MPSVPRLPHSPPPTRIVARIGRRPGATLVDRLVRQSQARVEDRVLIAGPCGTEMLLDLYRRGFHRVCHEMGDRMPVHDSFDVVWLLRCDPVQTLNRMLLGLGRTLRQGGTVVVHARHPAPSPTPSAFPAPHSPDEGMPRVQEVRRQFVACGLLPLLQVSDGGTGYLLSAHRPPMAARPLPATA
ncbi:hypothetical protein [Azospirillum picis]|uniref:Uncharacterized protein n=1 Tax=Azospirillum picis TaxID=488438 RepID=A0ABU0MRH7_9PROT|nr:hypothetical protein [Azospirillum picis]MBP2300833.1 hypothetical protein [Azospirillum picis]MDQ0536090.1 hypothetical protein [Azospirillum picis]